MAGANTTETFDCTTEQFFDIIEDYEKYAQFIPEVKSTRILEDQGARKLVEFEVSLIKSIKYRLWLEADRPNSIRWTLESGDLFKKQTGSWELSEAGGKTQAVYSLEVAFGMFVPGAMTKKVVEVNLPQMMDAYRKRVRELYG